MLRHQRISLPLQLAQAFGNGGVGLFVGHGCSYVKSRPQIEQKMSCVC
jgi:hypothetical protein